MKIMRTARTILLIAVTLGLAALAHATTVHKTTLEEMSQRADLIFRGTCDTLTPALQQSIFGSQIVVTTYQFTVQECLKGPCFEAILTFQQGGGPLPAGADAGKVMTRYGAPPYEVGAEYLLFLRKRSTGRYTPIGWQLGQFEVVTAADGTTKRVLNGFQNLLLIEGGAGAPAGVSKGAKSLFTAPSRGSMELGHMRELIEGYQQGKE